MEPQTILIVEDNIDTQLLYRKALKDEGYQVAMCSSGAEALNWLSACQSLPRLILLDLSMPEMSGEDFIGKLRANPEWQTIKIAIVSGWDNLKRRAQDLGVHGYIRKPFELDSFYGEIERLTSS